MTSSTKRRLLIDLETYSSADITKTGAFKYVEAPDFEILLLACAWDDGPVQVIDMTGREPVTDERTAAKAAALASVVAGITDPDTVKVAHNSAFERACLTRYLGRDLPPEEWEDTMILAAMNGLPLSLDAAGAALELRDQKIREGTALISYFCKPCRPTIANGGRTRNRPEHAPDKWERFKAYCKRDVEVEQAIYRRLRSFPVTDFERKVWALDARINERGVRIDTGLVAAAIAQNEAFTTRRMAEMRRLTGLENPNSVAQLKDWLETAGMSADSLNKAAVQELKDKATDLATRRVLELRQQLGKTSVTKYEAMQSAVCADGRVRGLLQYYGAGRTGRWAGRLVQVQNLPQNHLAGLGLVRELVRERDLETLELCFDSVPDVLSQLIRTAFVAGEGNIFHVADYSAIEARVIAYLAGEKWRMDVFRSGGDIYCSSASAMFRVPVVKHGVNGHLRQKGKIAELACGYGGGVGRGQDGADRGGDAGHRHAVAGGVSGHPAVLARRGERRRPRDQQPRPDDHGALRGKVPPGRRRPALPSAERAHFELLGRKARHRRLDLLHGPEPDHPQVGKDGHMGRQAGGEHRAGLRPGLSRRRHGASGGRGLEDLLPRPR